MDAIINVHPVSSVRTNIEDTIQAGHLIAKNRPEWKKMEVTQNVIVVAILAAAAATYLSAIL